MTKKDCPAFLPEKGDCGVDWGECTEFKNGKGTCKKDLTEWRRREAIKKASALRNKGGTR